MLTLTIEKKWFDMILSGEKTEEYRELKRYYDSRFRNAAMLKNQEYQASVSEFRNLAATVDQDIGTVRFRNGYTTDAPCFLADCKLTVGEGKPEWGAVPGTEYYILKMKNVRRNSMIFQYGDLLGRRKKDLLFDAGYRAAIDDMQDNLIRNSRTETIDGRTRLIVTEDTIETICREMRKRCK